MMKLTDSFYTLTKFIACPLIPNPVISVAQCAFNSIINLASGRFNLPIDLSALSILYYIIVLSTYNF